MFKTIKTNPAVLVYSALILITLFNHTIEVTEGNFVAHYILAGVFQDQGQFNKAVEHYEESLRIKPNQADAHNNLGVALVAQRRFSEAVKYYKEVLRLRPNYFEAHINLAVALSYQGKFDNAWQYYNQALRIKPGYVAPAQLMGVLSGKRRHGNG